MEITKELNIYIWAMAVHGDGISGGDRIFMEFARVWSKEFPVTIYLWEEGYQMLKRQRIVSAKGKAQSAKLEIEIVRMETWRRLGFVVNYIARIIEGIRIGLTLKIDELKDNIIYSASDFWMDSFPAFVLKLRYPKTKWVAAWYQTAPRPWVGFSEGDRKNKYRFKALIYWLSQLPVKYIISTLADFVLVNNDLEKKEFPKLSKLDRVIPVLGGVNLDNFKKWRKVSSKLPKIYDGVFQGRFHHQKGIVELIDIWRMVVNKKKDAQLALIGDGPLMNEVKARVNKLGLKKNVKLFGYVFDGRKKSRIFLQSKVVLHPSFYDSGGMASAEAMVYGLAAVGFNLKSYDYYYPKGMVKIKIGDLKGFADMIIKLLDNFKERYRIGKEGQTMIEKNWSWKKRSEEILSKLK